MPTSSTAEAVADVAPYRQYRATVSAVELLCPAFVRVTFTGEDLHLVGWPGADQRIKIAFPLPGESEPHLPDGPDWYQAYRQMDPFEQPPLRTYTIRAVRPEAAELDVDLVLHGDAGPASRWAARATPGQCVALVAPDARYGGPVGGFEWTPPAQAKRLLVAGDETAVPAAAVIASRLPTGCRADVLLEVPGPDDVVPLPTPDGVRVRWLPRLRGDGTVAGHGEALLDGVRALQLDAEACACPDSSAPCPQTDDELLWEPSAVDEHRTGGLYAWVAGEAAGVRGIRRYLVNELGVDRKDVSFMGYWRQGRSEA